MFSGAKRTYSRLYVYIYPKQSQGFVYALLVRGMDDKSPVYRKRSLERQCELLWVHPRKEHQYMDNMKPVLPGK